MCCETGYTCLSSAPFVCVLIIYTHSLDDELNNKILCCEREIIETGHTCISIFTYFGYFLDKKAEAEKVSTKESAPGLKYLKGWLLLL